DATQLHSEVALGATGIHIVETDSYAAYADNWRTTLDVRNDGTQSHHVVLYRVGDCASGEQDGGWLVTPGFMAAIQQSIGCRAINDGENAFQRVSLYSFPTDNAHGDDDLPSRIWDAVATGNELPSHCCSSDADQALGLSWPLQLAPGDTMQRTSV